MRSLEGSIVREKKSVESDSHYMPLHPNTSQELAVNTNVLHQTLFAENSCRAENVDDSEQLCPVSWGADLLVGTGSTDGGDVGEGEGEGNSVGREQLTEQDRQLAAALVAVQFVQQSGRHSLMQDFGNIAKVVSEGRVVESSSDLLDNSMRIYHEHVQDHEELRDNAVLVPNLLPPLPPLKRVWYPVKNNVQYQQSKNIDHALNQLPPEECEIDVNTPQAVTQNKQQNKKSLPHKKRISRKLKKNVPQSNQICDNQVNMEDDVQQAVEIIQESVNNQVLQSVQDNTMSSNQIIHNAGHPERALFICQLCGDYYGEDQLQFFHHLKQHYEPNTQTMILQSAMETLQHNHNGQITMDKIDDNIVVEGNQLPESLVELSLEGSVNEKQTLYTTHNKLHNYISVDKSLFVTNDKDSIFHTDDKSIYEQKQNTYTNIEKLYSCHDCNKTFKRHKQYEIHLRDVHSKMDEMSEFSEPEDLMEGIHVVVGPENEDYLQDDLSSEHSNTVLIRASISMAGSDQYILPHLTIDNGHAHQSHLNSKQWHIKEILGIETEKSVDSNIISDELSGDGGESMDGMVEGDSVPGKVVCSFCGIILNSKKDYAAHQSHCHMQEEVLQRMMNGEIDMEDEEVVDEEIIDESNLVVDENLEEEETLPALEKTEDKTSMEDEIETEKKETSKGTVYKCKECSREFKHRNSLTYHLQSHQGTRPFLCEVCNKRFFSASALKVHTRLHSGVKPYKCEECGRMFRQWGDLKYHCISIHSNMKQHQCEYCGKDFARKYSLIVHRRIHTGEKNYKCEFCDKKFRASSYLQNHRRIHTGEKPHNCDVCGKAFRMKGDMRRHYNTHKKEKPKAPNIKSEVEDTKETVPLTTTRRAKQKNSTSNTVTPKKELKEELRDADNREVNDVNTNQSPGTETQQDKLNSNCNNYQIDAPIYSWPVFIA